MNTNKDAKSVLMNWMADREGFEPSVSLTPHTLSKRAHSTTLTPALGGRDARWLVLGLQSLFWNRDSAHTCLETNLIPKAETRLAQSSLDC